MKHLRQGSVFYRSTLALMLPVMIQNLITNSLALCDTFMIGVLGEQELAAVTLANTPFFIISLIAFGVQSGGCVLVAQYYGKGDLRTINRVLGVGLYAGTLVTLFFAVLISAFPEAVMGVLTNNDALVPYGAEYARIIGYAYVFSNISGLYIAVQRSMSNPKLGAIVLGGSGVLNVFLNWVLIFGKLGAPALGIAGAAIATLICRVLEVVVVAVYAARDKLLPLEPRFILRPGTLIVRDFVRYAMPVLFNEALWSLATSLYSVIMGHMPNNTPILAAFTIAGNIERILSVAVFACGSAAAIIVGREIGSGKSEQVYSKGVALLFIAFLTGIGCSGLLLIVRFFFAESLIFPIMGLSADAVDIALYMLCVLAVMMPIRSMTIAGVVGVFRGGGDVKFALATDIVPMYLMAVPVCAVLALVLGQSIFVVYPFMFSDEVIKSFVVFFRTRSKKWINNVTREIEEQ